ncbi:hypothetical protein F2Q69_00024180 [Brassica cretica]|uniref:Uncharacterized protein n=1 Tax=Brassica cretica TaxID=69181 RepID=A0A8S9QKD7_BRACR|nr:hypothetical protein F2Q69_00024180 [Brassica cretica]
MLAGKEGIVDLNIHKSFCNPHGSTGENIFHRSDGSQRRVLELHDLIQPILSKTDSGGTSGDTALIAVKDPIVHVPKKMDKASTHVLKKARMP